MPVATDKRQKMFNARNLNSLYERFDQKCSRVLDNKTPLAAGLSQNGFAPFGVGYYYSLDPSTAFYVFQNSIPQSEVAAQLSKLEVKHLDVAGGQVYLDSYVSSFDPNFCNIEAIQNSFELHKRNVNGIDYDVHLGWDDPTGQKLSYCREYYKANSVAPTLPPGRIHKHKTAVAEIYLEGISQFRILNTYQRYDCWRVHNCSSTVATVYLQNPDGSAQREFIVAMGCRSFRRRSDGTWAATWPNGSQCKYFFPYFKGDVPYFSGGPLLRVAVPALAVNQERSARANNIANPFILTEWFRYLNGWLDPYLGLDITQMNPEYADPSNANTAIGDLIFTWGRAKVVVYSAIGTLILDSYFKVFRGVTSFIETLESIGINAEISGDLLLVSTKSANQVIRIYPVDCNVFFAGDAPYWQIEPAQSYVSLAYPVQYYTQTVPDPEELSAWRIDNIPTWFETIRTLRRRIAVEEGFINNYDDVTDISEEKIGLVTLTPLGMVVPVTTGNGIDGFDANALSELSNYERTANCVELRTEVRQKGFGAGIYNNTRYASAIRTYHIASFANSSSSYDYYGYLFPEMSTDATAGYPAVNCRYVPSGESWAFSTSVYDPEVQRVLENANLVTGIWYYGADFWINKWGGPNGVDASVRVLGKPNKTIQDNGVADDVFKDQDNAQMACLAPRFYNTQNFPVFQTYITDIAWAQATQFNLPYGPTANAENIYGGVGPLYHKIPKSAFLWNLLEYHIRAWTRAVPLCHGEERCPIYEFNAAGILQPSNLGNLIPKDLTATCQSSEGPSFYIDEQQYNSLNANGIQAKKLYDPSTSTYYWVVSQMALATYSNSKGFSSYNFDCNDQVLDGQGGLVTAGTKWRPMRNYGVGETVQEASYVDSQTGDQLYRAVRYVNLRLPNELGA